MTSEHKSRPTRGAHQPVPLRGRAAFRVAWAVLAALVATPATLARAEPPSRAAARAEPRAEPAEGAAYRELVEQALGEFKRQNWPEARSLFAQAHALNPNARTLRGLGVVSFEMREYVAAIVYLEGALAEVRQPLTDAQRGECQGLVTRARTYVGGFTPLLSPAEATLLVDGAEPVRDSSGALLLAFGEHALTLSAPGYQASTRRLQVQGGERTELRLELSPEPPPAPPMAAVIASPAGAPVSSPVSDGNGSVLASPSVPRAPLKRPLEVTTTTTGGLRYTWVALGAGVVFGGLAGGSYYAGQREYDRLLDRCEARGAAGNPCSAGDPDTGKVKRYERLSNAGLGLAAASAVGAVVLMAIEWPRERQLVVGVGPQSLTLRGAF